MKQQRPARISDRVALHEQARGRDVTFETVEFAKRRDKGRRRKQLAKASKRKNR